MPMESWMIPMTLKEVKYVIVRPMASIIFTIQYVLILSYFIEILFKYSACT